MTRAADPFRTRRTVLTATLFELLEDWHRSEYLFRQALEVVLKSDANTKMFRETVFGYLLRLVRINIRLQKLDVAARQFKESLDYSIDARRQEQPQFAKVGGGAYALLTLVGPALRDCSDEDVITFFDSLTSQCASNIAVRAWVSYRASEICFERLAVQAAKRRLGEAMDLAKSSSEYELYWLIVQQRLFNRIQQIYERQEDWLRDALDVVVALSSDDDLAQYRRSFAESCAQVVASATQGPFSLMESLMNGFSEHWQENAFLIVAHAIWRASTNVRILSTSQNLLESILKVRAHFLRHSDFE